MKTCYKTEMIIAHIIIVFHRVGLITSLKYKQNLPILAMLLPKPIVMKDNVWYFSICAPLL